MSSQGTRYSGLGSRELMGLFGSSSWRSMGFEERLDACQEVENRYAAANGVTPCTVTARPMLGSTCGWQSGRTITLNESLLRGDYFLTEDVDDKGNRIVVPIADRAPGWNMLDTVFHEGTHGIQTEQGRMPCTYIDPDSDRDLYRIQMPEKESYAAGEYNTRMAIQVVQQDTGVQDPEAAIYLNGIKNDSFEDALKSAKKNYQDPFIEDTLAEVIQDRDNNVKNPYPHPSYSRIEALLDEQDMRQQAQASQHNTAQPVKGDQQPTEPQNTETQNSVQDDGVQIPMGSMQPTQDLADDGALLGTGAAEESLGMDDGVSLEGGGAGAEIGSAGLGTGADSGGTGLGAGSDSGGAGHGSGPSTGADDTYEP